MIQVIKTHTGKIYVDRDRQLEFLTVGDYGKENNIKANFLGLDKEINGVTHQDVNLREKWVATISTQHGCPMRCAFCDVPRYGYHGNVSQENIEYQVQTILENEDVKQTKRFNLHFARMGEPTFNNSVLWFTHDRLDYVVSKHIKADTIHPVVSTMMPKHNRGLKHFLEEWCEIKSERNGEAGLQLSINSTSHEQRDKQFSGLAMSLQGVSEVAEKFPIPLGRKYTLNFAVTESTMLDAKVLDLLFDKNKFIVKLTPIHQTVSSLENKFSVGTSYTDFDVYRRFEEPLLELGWDVIVFVPSPEEDADRITCGNALIAETQ